MRKERLRKGVGAVLVLAALSVSGLWMVVLARWMDALAAQLLTGLLLAAGLWLLGIVDGEALGNLGEALPAAALGILLLLYGRVEQGGWLVVPPWHDGEWVSAVLPAATLAATVIGLLLLRSAERIFQRKWGGFSAQQFAVLFLVTAFACLHREMADRLTEIANGIRGHELPLEDLNGDAALWTAFRVAFELLGGLCLLPLVKRDRAGGAWLLGLGGGYLLLCLAGSWLAPGILRPLRWLGVQYGDAPLYAGLMAAGLYGLCPRHVSKA